MNAAKKVIKMGQSYVVTRFMTVTTIMGKLHYSRKSRTVKSRDDLLYKYTNLQ